MEKRVIALGFFDGVHKGHKALIDKANEVAKSKNEKSVVFTFTKHPNEVVFGEKTPFLVDENEREEQIKRIGKCDEVVFWDFNLETSKIPWDEFVSEILVKKYGAVALVSGEDFRFGYKGEGTSKKLEELCLELNIEYYAIKQVKIDDKRVSSTQIRELLSKGDIKNANKLLGHKYEISGEVFHGRKKGRELGFKTANIKMPQSMQTLPNGVYKTTTQIEDKIYNSTTNIGVVPSFVDSTEIIVETHIHNFDEEIYGEKIRVYIEDFIRAEKKFSCLDKLKEQIKFDVQKSKE